MNGNFADDDGEKGGDIGRTTVEKPALAGDDAAAAAAAAAAAYDDSDTSSSDERLPAARHLYEYRGDDLPDLLRASATSTAGADAPAPRLPPPQYAFAHVAPEFWRERARAHASAEGAPRALRFPYVDHELDMDVLDLFRPRCVRHVAACDDDHDDGNGGDGYRVDEGVERHTAARVARDILHGAAPLSSLACRLSTAEQRYHAVCMLVASSDGGRDCGYDAERYIRMIADVAAAVCAHGDDGDRGEAVEDVAEAVLEVAVPSLLARVADAAAAAAAAPSPGITAVTAMRRSADDNGVLPSPLLDLLRVAFCAARITRRYTLSAFGEVVMRRRMRLVERGGALGALLELELYALYQNGRGGGDDATASL